MWKKLNPDFERRHHLALLFAVDKAVVVLHRDERRELVVDRVVCWVTEGPMSDPSPTFDLGLLLTLHRMDCRLKQCG